MGSILLLAGLVALFVPAVGEPAQAAATPDVSIVWTCPLHREVAESAPGRCAECGRELVRARVQTYWSCPLHAVVVEDAPGTCPVCGRALYLTSRELSFSCPMHPDVRELEPGSCPICGMALVEGASARPHQDHNPKHGGIFFMAPDSWHHLEGTYPEEGLFRVYFYDNFSKPLNAAPFQARAVLGEVTDPVTHETREVRALPLAAAAGGEYLEARVGAGPSPREITARIRFAPDGPFERFDFVFAAATETAEPASAGTSDVGGNGGGDGDVDSPEAIAAAIVARDHRVRALVDRGALREIYVPALEAKDLALVLEARVGEAPESVRPSIRWAAKELVSAAWLLDDFGDLGNREKVRAAYRRFEAAAAVIADSYGVAR